MVKNMPLQCEIKQQLYRALPNRDMKEALQLSPGEFKKINKNERQKKSVSRFLNLFS